MEEATRCRPAAPTLPSSLFLTSRSKWLLLGGGTLLVAVTLLSGFWQNSYHPAEPHHIHLPTPTRDESSVLGFPPRLPLECQAFVTQPPKPSATTQQQQLHVSLVRSGPRSRRPILQLHGHATFVPNLEDDPPLYNYTCFALKARYNCAFSPPHPTPLQNASSSSSSKRHDKIVGRLAHQWKLVLQQQKQPTTTTTATNTNNTDRNSVCDLRHVVQHTVGGMPGVATFLWHNQQRHWTKTTASTTTTTATMQSIRPSPSKIINILILGNSYLRQVWESMACHYASHITNGFFQNGGPGIDKAARQGQAQDAKVYPQDVGEMVPFFAPTSNHTTTNPHTIPICHGALKQYQHFFHPNATLSSQRFSPQCNDNVAMVEFGNRLRVYYVFQPARYDNFTALLVHSLQLDPSQVHHVVWNGGGTDKLESRTMATPGQPPTPHNNDTNENEPWTWSHYNLANAKHVHHLLESAGVPVASWEEEPTDAPPSSPPRTTTTTTTTKTTITDWKRVLPFVRQLQQRQGPSYYYFGADNPGMHHPPDAHPCMPGLPDDQVALLLLVLVYQLELDL